MYDPALEYLPQFYRESRGDVILNPLDPRCPFWTPGDEVPHEAEALTVAASLFPERGLENRFFVDAPRKLFAHLIHAITAVWHRASDALRSARHQPRAT